MVVGVGGRKKEVFKTIKVCLRARKIIEHCDRKHRTLIIPNLACWARKHVCTIFMRAIQAWFSWGYHVQTPIYQPLSADI